MCAWVPVGSTSWGLVTVDATNLESALAAMTCHAISEGGCGSGFTRAMERRRPIRCAVMHGASGVRGVSGVLGECAFGCVWNGPTSLREGGCGSGCTSAVAPPTEPRTAALARSNLSRS